MLRVDVPPELAPLAAAALRKEAERRQRAATRAAGELKAAVAAGDVSDKRPGATRIYELLAEAADLVAVADALDRAELDDPAAQTDGRRIGDLEQDVEDAHLARIAAQNPGIDLDEVRATRRKAADEWRDAERARVADKGHGPVVRSTVLDEDTPADVLTLTEQ